MLLFRLARGLFFLTTLFTFSFQALAQDSFDIEDIKESIFDVCLSKKTKSLKKSCLLDAGRFVSDFNEAKKSVDGFAVIKKCQSWIGLDQKSSLYDLVRCVSDAEKIRNNHPNPQWHALNLEMNKFRSEWVSKCAKNSRVNVSKCVTKNRMGFYVFWRDYITVKSKHDFEKITKCVNSQNVFETNFAKYPLCSRDGR